MFKAEFIIIEETTPPANKWVEQFLYDRDNPGDPIFWIDEDLVDEMEEAATLDIRYAKTKQEVMNQIRWLREHLKNKPANQARSALRKLTIGEGVTMETYIEFDVVKDTGKTKVVDVRNMSSGFVLGQIKWYGRWRQYTFQPSPDTVFSVGCLEDINAKIDELKNERLNRKRG